MADEGMQDFSAIADSLKEGGVEVEQEQKKVGPVYQMIGDTKIPVSKSMGKLWKSRRDQSIRKLKHTGTLDAWDEMLRYYHNDQSTTAPGMARDPNTSRMAAKGTGETDQHIETENIVFANTSALVPATYAKNPTIEVTAVDQQDEQKTEFATVAKRLINEIFRIKEAPGVNLKPKARKAVIMTALTNLSYIEIGYTHKEQGAEAALQEISELSVALEKAKTPKEIEEIEGKLMAMEDKIDVLRQSGPWAKFRRPHDVLRDPAGTLSDLSDHNWVIVRDYIPTSFLRAVYYTKKDDEGKTGEYESIFAPTHVLRAEGGDTGHDLTNEVNTFSLLPDGDSEHKALGFEDDESFRKAQYTRVNYVWDKVTRRCYMFHDKDWTWPIWVWDDPTKLSRFYPLFPLEFYTDPENDIAKSEGMYYLDQQDAINEIHSERRRAISWARKNLFFNSRAVKDPAQIDAMLSGGQEGAVGLDVPEGTDITKMLYSIPPPSTNFMQLFDTAPYLQAIDRISSVTSVMRAAEFKTNTTNKAIETYQSQTQTRLDEKIDQIEDFVGDIGCGILEMCLQFMTADQVAALIGKDAAQIWAQMTPMTPDDLRREYNIKIVGGSALKPTSATKKEQAIQVGQVLGQFGKGTPVAVLVALKVMERAFDDLVITKEDWDLLIQAVQQSMQGPGGEGGQDPEAILAQVEQQIDAMPPEAKQALGTAMAKGVPIRQAMEQIMQRIAPQQGATPNGNQPQQ